MPARHSDLPGDAAAAPEIGFFIPGQDKGKMYDKYLRFCLDLVGRCRCTRPKLSLWLGVGWGGVCVGCVPGGVLGLLYLGLQRVFPGRTV